MSVRQIRLLILSFCLFSTALVTAQENSPFSRYGLGTLTGSALATEQAMGSLSASYRPDFNVNLQNPAGLSELKLTTFEAGLYGNGSRISAQDSNYLTGNANLNYLVLGVPVLRNRWGSAIGLMPFSRVNYRFEETASLPQTGPFVNSYQGTGSLYQIYWGNGVRFEIDSNHVISTGVRLGYIFGKLNYQKTTQFIDTLKAFNTRSLTGLNVGGITWNGGIQYLYKIDKDRFVVVGAYGGLKMPVRANYSTHWSRYSFAANRIVVLDTVYSERFEGEKIMLPAEITVGAGTGKTGRWSAGMEVQYTKWSQFDSRLGNDNLTDEISLRAGVQLSPKPKSPAGYLKTASFRLGGWYSTGNLELNGNRISDVGMTFGFGLPVKSFFSRVNLALSVGSRSYSGNASQISELYLNGALGFTLNDRWFIKRKFD